MHPPPPTLLSMRLLLRVRSLPLCGRWLGSGCGLHAALPTGRASLRQLSHGKQKETGTRQQTRVDEEDIEVSSNAKLVLNRAWGRPPFFQPGEAKTNAGGHQEEVREHVGNHGRSELSHSHEDWTNGGVNRSQRT
jgi:hypothetical protein